MVKYKPNEFAKLLNVSVRTLQRWDKAGILIADRYPTDRRYYTDIQLEQFNKSKIRDVEGSENNG